MRGPIGLSMYHYMYAAQVQLHAAAMISYEGHHRGRNPAGFLSLLITAIAFRAPGHQNNQASDLETSRFQDVHQSRVGS